MMLIRVNPGIERPIYTQIADAVRADLATGAIREGDVLPPAKEIAKGLDVNQHTVLRAYQMLRDEGVVDLRRGRGAIITPLAASIRELSQEMTNLARRAAGLGIEADTLAALISVAVTRASDQQPDQLHSTEGKGTEQ